MCVPYMSLPFFLPVTVQLALESPDLCLRLLSQAVLTSFVQEKSLEIYCISFSEQKCLGVLQGFNLERITVSLIYILKCNLVVIGDKNLVEG